MGDVITIDGPEYSGKTTAASNLAKYLPGYRYISSGNIYRGFAHALLPCTREEAAEKAARMLDSIQVVSRETARGEETIFVNGMPLTKSDLRKPEVNNIMAEVAGVIALRGKVNAFLLEEAKTNNLVVEGRDMAEVFRDCAFLMFLLLVNRPEQVRRCQQKYEEEGKRIPTGEEALNHILDRERRDAGHDQDRHHSSQRSGGPLRPPIQGRREDSGGISHHGRVAR